MFTSAPFNRIELKVLKAHYFLLLRRKQATGGSIEESFSVQRFLGQDPCLGPREEDIPQRVSFASIHPRQDLNRRGKILQDKK